MAILPPTSSPRAALRDFAAVFRDGDNRDRVLGRSEEHTYCIVDADCIVYKYW